LGLRHRGAAMTGMRSSTGAMLARFGLLSPDPKTPQSGVRTAALMWVLRLSQSARSGRPVAVSRRGHWQTAHRPGAGGAYRAGQHHVPPKLPGYRPGAQPRHDHMSPHRFTSPPVSAGSTSSSTTTTNSVATSTHSPSTCTWPSRTSSDSPSRTAASALRSKRPPRSAGPHLQRLWKRRWWISFVTLRQCRDNRGVGVVDEGTCAR
jgi:hypothetical protein